jgi:hypothetical protein
MGTFNISIFVEESLGTLLTIGFFWLLLLSTYSVFLFFKSRRLIKGVKKGDLIAVIDELIKREDKNTSSQKSLQRKLNELTKESTLHVQSLGLTKYNPFKEVGGDHSFSLTLLDGKDNGFVLTGLHTRDRTRVYIKDIIKGKAKVELSEEEVKSLKKARKK